MALIEEAVAIRVAACGKEILVFTPPTTMEEGYTLAVNGFSASVDSLKTAKLLCKVCETYRLPINVHLKVNTGMNRYGMNVQILGKVCRLFGRYPAVSVKGIYSHLCECKRFRAEQQRRIFARMVDVAKGYFPTLVAHLGGTYGALVGEKFTFDMVRVGLGLYGYLPCEAGEDTGVSVDTIQHLHLQKAMEVFAKAVTSRKYVFGGLGYGKETDKTDVGFLSVLRFGYADGFLRQRENGVVGWQEQANNLCMDACIRFGDLGRGKWVSIMSDAEKTAKSVGTIPYEVLCAATRRAELIYGDKATVCRRGSTRRTKGKESTPACVYEEKTDGNHQP